MKIKTQKILLNHAAENILEISRTVCRLKKNSLNCNKIMFNEDVHTHCNSGGFLWKTCSSKKRQPIHNINWKNDVEINVLNISSM